MSWPVTAHLTDGTVHTYATVDHVPASETTKLVGDEAKVVSDLAQGVTAYRYQKQLIRIGTDERLSIPVYQLRKDGQPLCFLFITPEGPVLSAKDIEF